MLAEIGKSSIEDLFASIPEDIRRRARLDLPPPLSEPEILDRFRELAARNLNHAVSFLGGGVYPHHIPAVVDQIASRSEFSTAYTPYQPEIAQGTLQAIFEFQTYITQLTGMDVANASLYDGSTALAEAVLMAHRVTGRGRYLLARSVHPEYRAVTETYSRNVGLGIETIDFRSEDGRVDLDGLTGALAGDVGAVIIQSPNFLGTIEETGRVAALAHRTGALAVVNVPEAMSLGVLRGPGMYPSAEEQADIVVGEAQSFGVPMSFGGPHVGFMATRSAYLRQLPGRLVGMGRDSDGLRAFVLTLAAREQHIRRERATSNICTNQSLCALMATVYLAALGPAGLRAVAVENVQKAAFVRDRIAKETAHTVLFDGPRFNEFVVRLEGFAAVQDRMLSRGIVAGLPLGRFYPELSDCILVCVTETHSLAAIDLLIDGLRP